MASRKDWIHHNALPDRLTGISQKFKDPITKQKQETNQFLDKEQYESVYVQMARSMKDDVVFGKPNFNLYSKPLKPIDLHDEFGGLKSKPFKCIY